MGGKVDTGGAARGPWKARIVFLLIGLIAGLGLAAAIAFLKASVVISVIEEKDSGSVKVVAMGDSYVSGEGAKQFFLGSDVDRNRCRRAPTAYPYVLKQILDLRLVFVACSGARTADILTKGQYLKSDPSEYGGAPQIKVLREHTDARVVVLGIGGNDAKFGDIGESCALNLLQRDCTVHAEEWIQNLDVVGDRLVDVYSESKKAAPDASLFVTTYPNPFANEFCDDIPTMNRREYSFLQQEFVPELNKTIRAAAEAAAVTVIDLENAFNGRRICEVAPKDAALNILGLSRRSPGDFNLKRAFHNSFHPNALGHTLIARVVGPVVGAELFVLTKETE